MMNYNIFLALFSLAFASSKILDQKIIKDHTLLFNRLHKNVHIKGGTNAKKGEMPYQCAILAYDYNPYAPICGCTILSPRTVVTAAHCAKLVNLDPIKNAIRYSTLKVETGSPNIYLKTDLAIYHIIIHPQYNTFTVENDIALIITKKPMILNRIKAAKALLPPEDYDPIDGTNVTTSGWGLEYNIDYIQPTKLKKLSITTVNRYKCKLRYGSTFSFDGINLVTDTMICAGGDDEGGEDVCSGDSGDPLVIGHGNKAMIVGILSKTLCGSPGHPGYPGIYTLVSKFLDFIDDNLL